MCSILKSSSLLKSGLNSVNRSALRFRANHSSACNEPVYQSNFKLIGAALLAGAGYYYYTSKNKGEDILSAITASLEPAIDPKEFKAFKLKEIQPISHDTKLFRFELPTNSTLGLPIASCVLTKAPGKDGKDVVRPYTPTSREGEKGYFDFIIKRYENGTMSKHIHSLKVGDSLEVRGPFPKYPYTANTHSEIGLIAGGTGITPMLQLIRKVLDNPYDNTKINFIFANRTTKDILLKDELDKLAKQHPDRFKVKYIISNKEPGWNGEVGHINKEQIKNTFKGSADKASIVFVCGPPGMVELVCGPKAKDNSQGEVKGILKDLGYNENNVYKF